MSRPTLDLSDALSRYLADNPDLPAGDDTCDESTTASEPWPRLDISYERKGRGGRPATIISGFGDDYDSVRVDELAATLKRRLATGGSARGGEILLQGDRRQELSRLLESMSIKYRIIT